MVMKIVLFVCLLLFLTLSSVDSKRNPAYSRSHVLKRTVDSAIARGVAKAKIRLIKQQNK
jgi:hypothetical protein